LVLKTKLKELQFQLQIILPKVQNTTVIDISRYLKSLKAVVLRLEYVDIKGVGFAIMKRFKYVII
jgi:hypothetical protein